MIVGVSFQAGEQLRYIRCVARVLRALGELKRARDQLRDPVEQIGVLLEETRGVAASTAALRR